MIHRIVITGAPASGKTLFFERAKNELFLSDFIFFDELARQLLIENQNYRTNWDKFHIDIYNRQIEREKQNKSKSFITDRGTVDTFAFHPQTAKQVNSTIEREYNRYTTVILLESSANLGDKFYKTDLIRNETAAEALKIEKKLQLSWSSHPKYYCIKADSSIEKKYSEFIKRLKRTIT
ncbi:MAG TPA: hypothetical protein ENH23_07400 [candidate division Zixibacteria bacterium]|nr:hypothetical protein [candidate division Zixibacteria bacterium]